MLTDAECDAIIEATFNGLEGIEVHMLGGDGWQATPLYAAPVDREGDTGDADGK